jgi:hypothetical protein
MELKIADKNQIVMENLISKTDDKKIIEQTNVTAKVVGLVMNSFENSKDYTEKGIYRVYKVVDKDKNDQELTVSLALVDDSKYELVDKIDLEEVKSECDKYIDEIHELEDKCNKYLDMYNNLLEEHMKLLEKNKGVISKDEYKELQEVADAEFKEIESSVTDKDLEDMVNLSAMH